MSANGEQATVGAITEWLEARREAIEANGINPNAFLVARACLLMGPEDERNVAAQGRKVQRERLLRVCGILREDPKALRKKDVACELAGGALRYMDAGADTLVVILAKNQEHYETIRLGSGAIYEVPRLGEVVSATLGDTRWGDGEESPLRELLRHRAMDTPGRIEGMFGGIGGWMASRGVGHETGELMRPNGPIQSARGIQIAGAELFAATVRAVEYEGNIRDILPDPTDFSEDTLPLRGEESRVV